MLTPTASKRLVLSGFFLVSGAALVTAGLFGATANAEETPGASATRPEEKMGPAAPDSQTLSVPVQKVGPVRVLVLGDSHTSSTFGRALDLLLRSRQNTEVTTVGACGHAPSGFLNTKTSHCGLLELHGHETRWAKNGTPPGIDDLLAHLTPELTIVELGANQIHSAWRNPKGAKRQIAALANKLLTRGSCVWVGPPTGREKEKPRKKIDHVYKLLKSALPQGCTLLDSRPEAIDFLVWNDLAAKAKRRGDGRHFDTLGTIGQQAARKWALHVFRNVAPALDDIGHNRPLNVASSSTRARTRLAFAD